MGLTLTEFNALLARIEGGEQPPMSAYRECSEDQVFALLAAELRRRLRIEAMMSLPAAGAIVGALAYLRTKKDKRA